MIRFLIITIVLWSHGLVFAQLQELTLKEAVMGVRTTLRVQTLRDLQWIGDSERFSFVDTVDSMDVLYIGNARHSATNPALGLQTLNLWLRVAGCEELEEMPEFSWQTAGAFSFWANDTLITGSLRGKALTVHTWLTGNGKAENRDVEPASLRVAFTRGNGLYIMDARGKEIVVRAADSTRVTAGQEIHRQEFGIRKGTFWSPGGNFLAFYEKDESPVDMYPYVDFTTRPASSAVAAYPMAGRNNHIPRVGVYNLATGKTVYLQSGDPVDQYLSNLAWSPDEKHLYLVQINRAQNHLRLVKYLASTGELLTTLFEETSDYYIDPQLAPVFFGDSNEQFIWLSRRDGWNHLYLYRSDGKLLRQLTSGEWEVTGFQEPDRKGRYACFTANRESPVQRDFYRVNLKSGKLQRLSRYEGTHEALVSASGHYFLDTFSSLRTPGLQELYDAEGQRLLLLHRAENPLERYRTGEVDILPLRGADSTKIFGRLVLLPVFDVKKQYPLLLYVYGGPHSQQVRNTWMGGSGRWPYYLRWLATRGYLVLTVDNRGTDFRGADFEQQTFHRLGTIELADQLEAIRQICATGYVDTSRIGVLGWSLGGFMAASLILRAPETFRMAVAGAPVIDWQLYESIYTERYMNRPEENEQGYQEANLLEYAANLRGKLLLIHGTSDPIVMWQHTIRFIDRAIEEGVQPDYFIYPGELHGVRGKKSLHLFERITHYIETHL